MLALFLISKASTDGLPMQCTAQILCVQTEGSLDIRLEAPSRQPAQET